MSNVCIWARSIFNVYVVLMDGLAYPVLLIVYWLAFCLPHIFFNSLVGPFCDSWCNEIHKKILVSTVSTISLVSTKEWNMCPYNPQALPFWHDILMLLLRKQQLQRDFPLMVFLKPINEASFYSWSSRFPSSRTCHKSKVSQEKLLSLVTMLRFDLTTCLQPKIFWEIVQRSTLDCHL